VNAKGCRVLDCHAGWHHSDAQSGLHHAAEGVQSQPVHGIQGPAGELQVDGASQSIKIQRIGDGDMFHHRDEELQGFWVQIHVRKPMTILRKMDADTKMSKRETGRISASELDEIISTCV
jgi:hypothetical protein